MSSDIFSHPITISIQLVKLKIKHYFQLESNSHCKGKMTSSVAKRTKTARLTFYTSKSLYPKH